ncbi:Nucleosomal histone H3-Lys79 methylase [Umbelopsis nana]
MELSSDEETWSSLRIDNSGKKQIPEKRHAESIDNPSKRANIEPTARKVDQSTATATAALPDGIDDRNPPEPLTSARSEATHGEAVTPLAEASTAITQNGDKKDQVEQQTDKSVAASLPSNGVQGLCSKLKNSHESTSSTPVCSPKSVKVKEIKHSERIVQAAITRYKPYFSFMSGNDDSDSSRELSNKKESMRVELEYPKPGVYERFLLLKPVIVNPKTKVSEADKEDKDEYNPITDLMRTATAIYEYFLPPEVQKQLGDDNQGTMRNLTKYRNRRNGTGFLKAVDEFNKVVRKFKQEGQMVASARKVCPTYELVCHILYQVYSRTVAPHAEALNNYQAFSNHVYGEINSILIKEFIERTNINSKSVFIDMGCGIGNVVLQVAAQTACEAHGIEIMETPCKLAKLQLKEYATRMRAWQLPSGNIRIRLGNFLESPEIHQALKRADVILVNNYAFDSNQNQALCHLFLDLKEGAQIISLKSFVPIGHKLTERTAHAPESILRVKKYPYYTEAVSWTHNGGTYYISTVDRGPVQRFYKRLMG